MRSRYSKMGAILTLLLASTVNVNAEQLYDDDGNPIESIPQEQHEDLSGFQVNPNAGDGNSSGAVNDSVQPTPDVQIDREDINQWVEQNKNDGKELMEALPIEGGSEEPPLTEEAEPPPEIVEEDKPIVPIIPPMDTSNNSETYQQLLATYANKSYYEKMPAELRPSLVNFDKFSSSNVGEAIEDFGYSKVLMDHYLVRENLYNLGQSIASGFRFFVEIEDVAPTLTTGPVYIYPTSVILDTYTDDYRSKALARGTWKRNASGGYEVQFDTNLAPEITAVLPQVNIVPASANNKDVEGTTMNVDKGFANYPAAVVAVPAMFGESEEGAIAVRVNSVDKDVTKSHKSSKKIYQFNRNITGVGDADLQDFVNPHGKIRTVIPLGNSAYPAWSVNFNPELGKYKNNLFTIEGDKLVWSNAEYMHSLPSGTMSFAVLSETGQYEFISLGIFNGFYNMGEYNIVQGYTFNDNLDTIATGEGLMFMGNEDNPFAKVRHDESNRFILTTDEMSNLDTYAYANSITGTKLNANYNLVTSSAHVLKFTQAHALTSAGFIEEDFTYYGIAPYPFEKWNTEGEVTLASNTLEKIPEGGGANTAYTEYYYKTSKSLSSHTFLDFYMISGNSIGVRRVYNLSEAKPEIVDNDVEIIETNTFICNPIQRADGKQGCSLYFPYRIGEDKEAVFQLKEQGVTIESMEVTSKHFTRGEDYTEIDLGMKYKLEGNTLTLTSKELDNLGSQKVKVNFTMSKTNEEGVLIKSIESVIIDVKPEVPPRVTTMWYLNTEVFDKRKDSQYYTDLTLISSDENLETQVKSVYLWDWNTTEENQKRTVLEKGKDYRVVRNQIIISKETLSKLDPIDVMSVGADYGDYDDVELMFEIIESEPNDDNLPPPSQGSGNSSPGMGATPLQC